MQNYLDLLKDVKLNGIDKSDRTGIGSRAVFGRLLRWDLAQGFPIQTTRKVPLRIAFEETMFFLRGETNTKLLEDKKINIWKGNTTREFLDKRGLSHLPEGSLGRGYGHMWRKWELKGDQWLNSVELIPQSTLTGNNSPFSLSIPIEAVDYTASDDFVGKIFKTNTDGDIIVLKKLPTRKGNTYYKIQFLSGINFITEVSRPSIRSGHVRNAYSPTLAGGVHGPVDRKSSFMRHAYTMWQNMMERCHGNDPLKTINYKNRGIFVDSHWRCFTNFYNEIQFIPGFDDWKNNPSCYQLDKDYFGNKFYSKDTVIFLPRSYNENILNNSYINGQLYTAENKKTGEIFRFTAPYFFNKHTNTSGMVDRAFLNQNGNTRVWKFKKELPPSGFKWRQKFYVDQIADLLNGIKKDPLGRRHVVTGWNPGQLDEMALPPCHMMQMHSVEPNTGEFSVGDGKLHTCFVMRSNDVPFGLPFNIMSYALINHIFAKHLGLMPGDLVYMGWDVHIYQNQMEMVDEVLQRTPRALPTINIKKDLPTLDDILSLQWEDIELIGYDPYPDVTNKPGMAI